MDAVFKQKYEKYKMRVKVWERDFKKKFQRVPSKYDIHEAPQEIRDSYKMYYRLKTSFLEDTLNDVLAEDGFDVLEISQAESVSGTCLDDTVCDSISGPQLPLDISAIMEASSSVSSNTSFSNIHELPTASALSNIVNLSDQHVIKAFEAVEHSQINEDAWGSNVSKKDAEEVAHSSPHGERKAFRSNLSHKLFKTVSFSKRNPRKSLSRSNSHASQLSSQNSYDGSSLEATREALPDLETILLQKAKETQAAAAISANPLLSGDKLKETPKLQVDEGWLNRTAAQISLKTDNVTSNKTEDIKPALTKNAIKPVYGMSNIDISKIMPSMTVSQKTSKNVEIVLPQIKEIEVKLASSKNATSNSKSVASHVSSDSDSVVGDSEGENEPMEYRHMVKRRRVLANVNKNDSKESPNATVPLQKAQENQKEVDGKVFDFVDADGDDEKDKDYAPEKEKAKQKRPKAVAKRSARAKAANAASAKDEQKTTGKRSPTNKSTRTTKKTPKRGNKKTKDTEAEINEVEEQPLKEEDLKYALVLERGSITSVPRVKLADLEKADDIAQNYINNVAPRITTAARSSVQIDEKREAARKKLEEKIASGKLNENFVTINIQKKVFARGKKSVNYSKYKKKQWKDKKRVAALTGPDMDMGGCDGGVLKCFTCGQTGHFARECKMKGDVLLPLTAQLAEDPSPFPTLEEAERMASQSALAVHSRNISKLPAAGNAAIYRDAPEMSEVDVKESARTESSDAEASDHCMETDDELESMDLDAAIAIGNVPVVSPIKQYVGHKIPADFLKKAGLDSTTNGVSSHFGSVGPLYDLNEDGSVKDATPDVLEALRMFGHTSFRKGQDRAIMRILSGLSTLVTLSTGSGKSLCYQLPAYLYSRQKKSITLVISPLVSLMEDQVTGVPHFLRAHCLHTNQTPHQRMKIMQLISDGEIDILLVSPEAVVAGERSTGFGAILRQLPPIAFACIDEAHCVSQWSHNFRPSYLMICKVLKQNLGVRTVLGLTATATLPTRLSIIDHLGIADGERGIISDTPLPDNLILSVSKDENRDEALVGLLTSKRFNDCQSVIIYCTRRDVCERVSAFIRTCLQDRTLDKGVEAQKKKRKRVAWQAEPYHAGMPASRRRTIQNAFMKNELRIVVATIAFGMGINKPDIRAVIHYNMPRNFESYVQEIGRAGRDGKLSHCHLFLDARGGDQSELRRHVYANSIDRHVIRKLLQHVFVPCSCEKTAKDSLARQRNADERACPGHEIGFSNERTVEALDIPAENISTLLCYLELDTRWRINVLSSAYIMAKVISYGGAKYLKYAAKECPPLAMAIALEIKRNNFKEDANIIEFSVVDIAAAIGWNSGVVKFQLKNLEWVQMNGYPKRSPMTVSFYDLGFRIKAPGDFTAEEIDEALDTLYNRSVKQEKTQLIQLQYVFQGLSSVAYKSYMLCTGENFSHDRSDQLKGIVRDYFQNDYPKDLKLEIDTNSEPDDYIVSDVNALINMYPDNNFSGRNIARIFHGISSPNYPALMWGRCKYWRAHSKSDFNHIVQLANSVIVKRRT